MVTKTTLTVVGLSLNIDMLEKMAVLTTPFGSEALDWMASD